MSLGHDYPRIMAAATASLPTENLLRAVILAAGLGHRLGAAGKAMPKILLSFNGRTLLERHLTILRALGVSDVTLGIGYGAELIETELLRLGAIDVGLVHNPDYREGSIVTLAHLGAAIAWGGDILLMDGDVLYDRRMLDRLFSSKYNNAFLIFRIILEVSALY